MERRAIKIRIYPNKNQEVLIINSLGCTRFIYNKALNLKKQRYENFKENLSWVEISKMITFWKKTEELSFLKEPPSSCLIQSLRNIDKAFKNFFEGRSSFPKFKKKFSNDSFTVSDLSRILGDNYIKLPKIGIVKIKGLRNFNGEIKNVTVTRNSSLQYFASFSIEDVEKVPTKEAKRLVGIDVNLENYLTDSEGNRVENPKFKNSYKNKLKFYQRKLSKSKPKSRNREKWRLKIARLYQKIANKKQNFLHNLSHYYVKNHDVVVIERLVVKNMVKNKNLAESISNVSWSEFFRQLKYKSTWYGCQLIEVAPHNTSKTCSDCGVKNEELTLKDRDWKCLNCGSEHIRDFNSAKNIKLKGISSVLKSKGDTDNSRVNELASCLI